MQMFFSFFFSGNRGIFWRVTGNRSTKMCAIVNRVKATTVETNHIFLWNISLGVCWVHPFCYIKEPRNSLRSKSRNSMFGRSFHMASKLETICFFSTLSLKAHDQSAFSQLWLEYNNSLLCPGPPGNTLKALENTCLWEVFNIWD